MNDKKIGIFKGCQTSHEKECDELHLKLENGKIECYPISMLPAVSWFVELDLKREDKIQFELHDDGWVKIDSLKILEKGKEDE